MSNAKRTCIIKVATARDELIVSSLNGDEILFQGDAMEAAKIGSYLPGLVGGNYHIYYEALISNIDANRKLIELTVEYMSFEIELDQGVRRLCMTWNEGF